MSNSLWVRPFGGRYSSVGGCRLVFGAPHIITLLPHAEDLMIKHSMSHVHRVWRLAVTLQLCSPSRCAQRFLGTQQISSKRNSAFDQSLKYF